MSSTVYLRTAVAALHLLNISFLLENDARRHGLYLLLLPYSPSTSTNFSVNQYRALPHQLFHTGGDVILTASKSDLALKQNTA